ncbi:MAG: alkaline phosphatase family protein [Gammaproteobacteria bacterium]
MPEIKDSQNQPQNNQQKPPSPIKHLFVLMLENRSFDHIFGFSRFEGADPRTGVHATARDLTGFEPLFAPTHTGRSLVREGAPYQLDDRDGDSDPGHEFTDTVLALCGKQTFAKLTDAEIARKLAGDEFICPSRIYPAMLSAPTQWEYAVGYGYHAAAHPDQVLRCFSPSQLPVLNQLAAEFVLCDNWFSSMPGPAWPNRFFALCGSSGHLDHSPAGWRAILADAFNTNGYKFVHGSMFDHLDDKWLIVRGDNVQALAIEGLDAHVDSRMVEYDDFHAMLKHKTLDASFIWLEPDYGAFFNFRYGNSMHPYADVRKGEWLVKNVYEHIRQSAYWESSALLVLFDEHGGFYDHVKPPGPDNALIPGDANLNQTGPDPANKHDFKFDILGPRVPAIVISPWVTKHGIDKTRYDHASIARTAAELFDRPELILTKRVANAASFHDLFNLKQPRLFPGEAPWTLNRPIRDHWSWLKALWPRRKPKQFTAAMWAFSSVAVREKLARTWQTAPMQVARIGKMFAGLKNEEDGKRFLKSTIGIYRKRRK